LFFVFLFSSLSPPFSLNYTFIFFFAPSFSLFYYSPFPFTFFPPFPFFGFLMSPPPPPPCFTPTPSFLFSPRCFSFFSYFPPPSPPVFYPISLRRRLSLRLYFPLPIPTCSHFIPMTIPPALLVSFLYFRFIIFFIPCLPLCSLNDLIPLFSSFLIHPIVRTRIYSCGNVFPASHQLICFLFVYLFFPPLPLLIPIRPFRHLLRRSCEREPS